MKSGIKIFSEYKLQHILKSQCRLLPLLAVLATSILLIADESQAWWFGNKTLNVKTPEKYRGRLEPDVSAEADLLNAQLKNIKASVDKKKGLLVVEFDYPAQTWTLGRNLSNMTWFESPLRFFIKIFDKNGRVLEEFGSKKFVIPRAALDLIQKNKKWKPSYWDTTEFTTALNETGNKFEFPISEMVGDYAEKIEFGFSSQRLAHKLNTWAPSQERR